MIAVKIDNAPFRDALKPSLDMARNPRAVMAGVGREAANQLRAHFLHKDQTEPNKLGGPREHFWRKVQQSVNAPVVDATGHTVRIEIAHPAFAQKLFGGTITAKRVANLAIPQTPEAYGRAPRVFEQETGLKLFFLKQGPNIFLAADVAKSLLQIEYVLTPSVHQDPDPTALPPQDKFEAALIARAKSIAERQAHGAP